VYRLGQHPEGILNVAVCILSGSRGDPEPEQRVLFLHFTVPERIIHIIAWYNAICSIGHKEISLDVSLGDRKYTVVHMDACHR